MFQPLSETNLPLEEPQEGIVEDENGGGRTTSEQNQKEANESEHEKLKSQPSPGRADGDIAIDLHFGREGENTTNLSDVNQMRDEHQGEEKSDASKQVVPGKMTVDQSLPIMRFGNHGGGEECPCEDCYKKRKIAEAQAKAMTVEKEKHLITALPPSVDPPPTPSPSLPPTPARPARFGPAENNSTPILIETDVLNTAPIPSEEPSSPSDPTTPSGPTSNSPDSPSPVPSLVSSPPPLSPPAEDTHIMITEEQDGANEEPQEQELTEEEKQKTQTIVEDLYEELIEEKTGGCCRGCCHLCCLGCCGQALSLSCDDKDCHQEVFTPALKEAARSGLKMFRRLVWPLAPALLRDVWVSLEWILGLLALILSIVQFAVTGGGEVFNSIHLVLAAFGFLLASIDALVQLTEVKSCKECYHLCCGNGEGKNGDKGSGNLCCCCCSRSTRGGKVLIAVKNVFDVARILISELILSKGWEFENFNDTIDLFLFLLSLGSLLLLLQQIYKRRKGSHCCKECF